MNGTFSNLVCAAQGKHVRQLEQLRVARDKLDLTVQALQTLVTFAADEPSERMLRATAKWLHELADSIERSLNP